MSFAVAVIGAVAATLLAAVTAAPPPAGPPTAVPLPATPQRPHAAPKPGLPVRPGVGVGAVTLGMPRAALRRQGAKPGFTPAVSHLGPIYAAFHGAPPVASTVWVELAKRRPLGFRPRYAGEALNLRQPPAGIALAFGACEPVEHLTGNNRVQCQGGRVSVEWNLCPHGLAGPCRDLRLRVTTPTRTAQKNPTCDAYVYGDLYLSKRGVQPLALRPKLPAGSNVCLGAMPLRAGMSHEDVRSRLSSGCKMDWRRGGSWMRCPGLGVALGFSGPTGRLSVLALDSDGRLGPAHPFGGPSTLALYEVVPSTAPGAVVLWDTDGRPVATASQAALTSADVSGFDLSRTPGADLPALAVTFTAQGAKRFEALTRRLVGRKLAIAVDGCVYAAPVVQEAITGGKAFITLPPGQDAEPLLDALRRGLRSVQK